MVNDKTQFPNSTTPSLPHWLWKFLPVELQINEQPKTINPDLLQIELNQLTNKVVQTNSPPPPQSDQDQDLDTLVILAVETWRLQRRVEKLKTNPDLGRRTTRPLESSVNKLKDMLAERNIDFHDHTGRLFHEGMRDVNVLASEQDSSSAEAEVRITETVSPSVSCNGKLVQRAKVITTSGTNDQDTENDRHQV